MMGRAATVLPFASRVAAALAVLATTVVLIGGWALDVAALRGVLPGLATMRASTALGLAGAGAALWLLREGADGRRRRAGLACAVFSAAIGLLPLAEHVFGWSLGIDELFVADPAGRAAAAPPGGPTPSTALGILFLGLALLLLDHEARRGRRPAEWLAIAAGLIALVGLLGYAYGSRSLYAVELYSSMPPHTASLIFILAFGILCTRPQRGLMAVIVSDGAGGYLARRLLPAAVLIPPALGGIRLIGERAGLYGFQLGLALFAAANAVVFAVLVWWTARSLHGVEARRRQAEIHRLDEDLEQRVVERTTKPERAIEALRNEVIERKRFEERFRGLFESAPDAVIISDTDGRIVLVNAQAEELLGYGRAELIGQAIEVLLPERHRGRHITHRAGYVADPHARTMGAGLELFARCKSGREIPVDISLSPIETDDGMLVFSNIRDDTWRKRVEYELRDSEARFRAVAETANDAVITADRDGNVVYFNAAAGGLFGYAAEEMIGRPLTQLMPERFRTAHTEGLRRFLSTGQTRVIGETVELAGIRKNGEEFPLELSLASWQTGDETHFTGLVRDITDRKAAERSIQELNESLSGRNAELQAVNKELEAFSYSVSHDLRAPLRAIDGFSRILLAEHTDMLDDTGQDHLARVRRAAQDMGVLIDDLLELSRVTRAEPSLKDVDLSALAGEVVEILRKRDPQRNVRFDITPGLRARGDARLLRIALENLMSNAWKFTARRDEARIELGATTESGEPAYFVRDNGAGFDMAYAGKLFGAFQRLHDVSEFPGTGIGLATVQRIVHKHGGGVWAEGAVDQGATFFFTLARETHDG